MGFFSDFKQFAMRGNVLDLAVGVIIGAAFGTITKSLVDDVMMPPLGLVMGKVDFKEQYIPLDLEKYDNLKEKTSKVHVGKPTLDEVKEAGLPTIRYGLFLNAIINFIFVAFAVFLLVKGMMKLQREAPPPKPAEMTTTEKLLTEIRDELKVPPKRTA
jgi:large conductance mechanosensitive channel